MSPCTCPTDTSHQDVAGEVLKRRSIGPYILTEHLYSKTVLLPKHSHRHAFLTFVMEGTFRERCGAESIVCRPGALRFLPAEEVHRTNSSRGSRCLHVWIDPAVLDGLDRRSVVPRKPAEISGLGATWLANRLYAEFCRKTRPRAWRWKGWCSRFWPKSPDRRPNRQSALIPRWLKQATEIVETRFLERLSLTDIASEVGVHYVHLSRQFHKYNRCTVGELIRRRRIQYASHLLAHSETPLGGDRADLRILGSEPSVVPVQALYGNEPVEIPRDGGAWRGRWRDWRRRGGEES